MPENVINIVITSIFIGIGALAMGSIIVRTIKNRYAPIKKVKAVIIDKNKSNLSPSILAVVKPRNM